ncbi:MAG: PepSY domain-containing protein [Hyphomicrobium sp.]
MKHSIFAALAAAAMFATPAFADSKPSDDEAKKLTEAAAALGYTGGTAEKETEGTGVYEIDDAKLKDGSQYDLKFDKDFKLLSVTRD